MSMMALVGPEYEVYYVSYGSPGSDSDTKIFNNSTLKTLLENDILPEGYFIVGDDAFTLRPYLMKPYPGQRLTEAERIFNYRLSRARNVVENFFGFLANRFRVLLTSINLKTSTVELIIRTCCILHNLLLKKEGNRYMQPDAVDRWDANGQFHQGSWRGQESIIHTTTM